MSADAGPAPVFTGSGKPSPNPFRDAWNEYEPYVASPNLIGAVNMALILGRPLLLEGEPGSGKTRLAYAVAYELGYPLKEIYVRSTSRAKDLLYTFDAVRRLYDIQERAATPRDSGAAAAPPLTDKEKRAEMERYVELGELGEAIELSKDGVPSVVLIDEIDKADIDFPNDLLLAVERLWFDVDEVKDLRYDANAEQQRRGERPRALPLVIVTSNREKELPAPFLRRCLFAHIPFPEAEMAAIVARQFSLPVGADPLVNAALAKFTALRKQQWFAWRKAPGTSELLDWVAMLRRGEQEKNVSADELAARPLGKLPYTEALAKTKSDRDGLEKIKSLAPTAPGDG